MAFHSNILYCNKSQHVLMFLHCPEQLHFRFLPILIRSSVRQDTNANWTANWMTKGPKPLRYNLGVVKLKQNSSPWCVLHTRFCQWTQEWLLWGKSVAPSIQNGEWKQKDSLICCLIAQPWKINYQLHYYELSGSSRVFSASKMTTTKREKHVTVSCY